jgi:hypothetical protein
VYTPFFFRVSLSPYLDFIPTVVSSRHGAKKSQGNLALKFGSFLVLTLKKGGWHTMPIFRYSI